MQASFQPVDAAVVPRFAGIATFMRLPLVASASGRAPNPG
jgi:guanidinopropionase